MKILIISFTLAFALCLCSTNICGPEDIYQPCHCQGDETEAEVRDLMCIHTTTLPHLNDTHFSRILLKHTLITNRTMSNVTCDLLELQDIPFDNILPVESLTYFQNSKLILTNVDGQLITQLTAVPQTQLKVLDVSINETTWKLPSMINFHHLESITISCTNQLRHCLELHSNVFRYNEHLTSLVLDKQIHSLADHSLTFNSANDLSISLDDNSLTIDKLRKAKLSNAPGSFFKVSLAYNQINDLAEDIFLALVDKHPQVRIDMTDNPIICSCQNTSWVFDNQVVKTKRPILNVQCVNLHKFYLYDLSKEILCGPNNTTESTETPTETPTTPRETPRGTLVLSWWHILLLSIAGVIVATISLFIFYRKFRHSNDDQDKNETIDERKDSFSYIQFQVNVAKPNSITIERSELQISQQIGNGEFSVVHLAHMKDCDGQWTRKVVVKKAKSGQTLNTDMELLTNDEVMLMKNFNHDNVIQLIGVCFDDNKLPMIIMPYMENGSLLAFVRNNQVGLKLTLLLALQVAQGMEYLSSNGFVHRDLSARNVLLDHNLTVKVSDFGLTKRLVDKTYYRSQTQTHFPINWMAIESLEELVYTVKSDVWSYGVLVWELLSKGSKPYDNRYDWERLILHLKSGRRLPKPDCCRETTAYDSLYELCVKCWHKEPELRPDFTEIICQINTNQSIDESIYCIFSDYLDFQTKQTLK